MNTVFNNNSKRDRAECPGSCKADTGHVFAETLKDPSFHDILFDYLKKLDIKVVKINEVADTTKES